MSKVSTYASAVLCLLVFVAFASAQPTAPTIPATVTFSGAGLGAGIGIAISILGAGWGFGRIGAAALESMARQPDKAGEIQTAMIIIGALLEGATLLALIMCFLVAGYAKF